jgi:hypothetical protein
VRVERRQLTRREWAAITSSRPVVRQVLERRPQSSRPENPHSPGPRVIASSERSRGTRPGQSPRETQTRGALSG